MSILFRPELAALVMAGQKTQTRRTFKVGDHIFRGNDGKAIGLKRESQKSAAEYRFQWKLGQDYAVCPRRGKFSIGRVRVTNICRELDVRYISESDAQAEGFDSVEDFLHTWVDINDRGYMETFRYALDTSQLKEYGFFQRPAHRYDAWVLTFKRI